MPLTDPILVVEDSENDAMLFSVALEEAEVANPIVFTTSYHETVDYFAGTGKYSDRNKYPIPSVVFLDVHMPKHSGFDVLSWLRSNEVSRSVTVIMISGAASPQDVERAYSLGANFYLEKPVAADDLIQALRRVRVDWLDRKK